MIFTLLNLLSFIYYIYEYRKERINMFKLLIGFFLGMWASKKLIPGIDTHIENIKCNTAEILATEEALTAYFNEMLMDLYRKGELEQKVYELTGVRIVINKALDVGTHYQPIITIPSH